MRYLEAMSMQTASGLSTAQATTAQQISGYNQLPTKKPKPLVFRVIAVFAEPMLLLLIAAGILSLILADPLDTAVLMIMIAGVVGITLYQQERAEKALQSLQLMASPTAMVLRDGSWARLEARLLVVGDLVRVAEGERVPADLVVLESSNFSVDESALTGESLAVEKPAGQQIFSGTLAILGRATARVEAIGPNTELGKIGASLVEIGHEKTRLEREINKIVKIIAAIAVVASATVVILLGLNSGDWLVAMISGIATAMAMIPEELPVILTLFFALGAWRMSKERVLTRRSAVIETLGSATVICVDKTGTLTMNQMSVDSLILGDTQHQVAAGEPDQQFAQLVRYGQLATPRDSFDPVDRSFVSLKPLEAELELVREYPLTPELMAMTLVWKDNGQLLVATKGAPEAVAKLCGYSDKQIRDLTAEVTKAANTGRRIIAVAMAKYSDSQQLPDAQKDLKLEFLGMVSLRDQIRPGVPQAVAECHQAGIRVIMITGDFIGTARAIASEIGIDKGSYLTGSELDSLNDQELAIRVRDVSVCARMTPGHKLRLISALKANNEVVAMTGDGVNDAPALKQANISIAMGLRGTDVAREASHLIITDDDFSSIVAGVKRGRSIYEALRKAVAYVIAVHVPLMGMALIPVMSQDLPLILLPAMVAFVEMVIDPACTVIFQAEQPEPNIMRRKPRPIQQKLLNLGTLWIALSQGLVVLVFVAAQYFWLVAAGRVEIEVRSMTLALMIVANFALIMVNRSWSLGMIKTIRERKNASVKWVIGIALALLIVLVEVPVVADAFELGRLSVADWVQVIVLGFLSVLWFDIYKKIQNRRRSLLPVTASA